MSHKFTLAYCLTLFMLLYALFGASSAFCQTTAFTYQGKLTDGGTPANGTYEMQFKLYDAFTAGTQQPQASPTTLTFVGAQSVQVSSGVFTVQLDFGTGAFTGANRFLEIAVFNLVNER